MATDIPVPSSPDNRPPPELQGSGFKIFGVDIGALTVGQLGIVALGMVAIVGILALVIVHISRPTPALATPGASSPVGLVAAPPHN